MNRWRARAFGAIARLDAERPWLVLGLAGALAVACILYSRACLEFRTDESALVNADTHDTRIYQRYTEEFPDLDGLIVAIRTAPSRPAAERFADALARHLNADTLNVKSVFYRIDPRMLDGRALLYLDLEQLQALAGNVAAALPFLRAYAAAPTLAHLFEGVLTAPGPRSDRAPPPPTAAAAQDPSRGLALLDAVLAGMLNGPAAATAPWDALVPHGAQDLDAQQSYVTSPNGAYLLMEVAPANGADSVAAITDDINAIKAFFPGVEAGMTGSPALTHAEQVTTQHDMLLGSIIGIIGLVLLLVIPFRGVVEPFFAIVALLIGAAWSFGFTTLAVGHLNLLSAVFTSVLVGIGINFPIHLMARYDEARRKGAAMAPALELAVVNTGVGVFSSACIMTLAFLMPMFTDFRGIAELGEVSAAGLFLCLLSALLVFPALIALRDRNRGARPPLRVSFAPRKSMLERWFARPGWILGLSLLGTLAALPLARRVRFDQNVLRLQATDAEAVRYENILLRDSSRSSWFAVSMATTREQAERRAAAFRQLPVVSAVETIGTYIPTDQPQKLALIADLRRQLAPLQVPHAFPPETPQELRAVLEALHQRIAPAAAADPSGQAAKTLTLLNQVLDLLNNQPRAYIAYETQLADQLRARLTMLDRQLDASPVTEATLPNILRQRFIGKTGVYLVQIYPAGEIWDDAPLQRFISSLQTVDPDVTGPPVETYNLATVMRHGYERAATMALIAVFVFVVLDFRNLRDALLATVPLLFGGCWLLETMGYLGWEFNLANLFAVPIIIGMGVDNGVNMLYRWREEHDKSSLILTRAVGKSVTICSLTTIAAFAALIPANHRGISSLGWVMTIGVSLILLATLIVLPALFELLGTRIHHADEGHHDTPLGAVRRAADSAQDNSAAAG
ncbi:MAG TPA: MMPL family transporter [Candidatus Binataceae bacterium]|nr:MMPL family transporter [Candidatus Binataceae bacterium]